MNTLTRLRTWALRVVAGLVVLSTVASIADSYRGLVGWAAGHGMTGLAAYAFPLFIDAFPLAGEIALFVAMLDGWDWRARVYPWLAVVGGLGVSVAANVGHLQTTDVMTRITSGMPPVAAWVSLVVGFGLLKRVMANRPAPVAVETTQETTQTTQELETVPTQDHLTVAAEKFADHVAAGRIPGLNRIRRELHVGHEKAPQIQNHLRELAGLS